MKNEIKMVKLFRPITVSILMLIAFGCSDDQNNELGSDNEVVSLDAQNSIVRLTVDDVEIPVYLSIPDCEGPVPAVVVLHGSNGMWRDNDPNSQEMSGQFVEWRDLLLNNCIAAAFVDSYSPRGVTTRTGDLRTLPKNTIISAQFVRPKDANTALEHLRLLKDSNGKKMIQEGNISVLGFSDGASAAVSTLIDLSKVPSDFEWTQSANGIVYDESDGVLPPPNQPNLGFASGVFYYGGHIGYNYWGRQPCGLESLEDNIYMPYAPVLYHVPSEDSLSENTLCMLNVLNRKGAPITLEYYPGAPHGFDFDDIPESDIARERTLEWLRTTWTNP